MKTLGTCPSFSTSPEPPHLPHHVQGPDFQIPTLRNLVAPCHHVKFHNAPPPQHPTPPPTPHPPLPSMQDPDFQHPMTHDLPAPYRLVLPDALPAGRPSLELNFRFSTTSPSPVAGKARWPPTVELDTLLAGECMC